MIIIQAYTSAHLKYRGHVITVRRWKDLISGEILQYQAVVDDNDEWAVNGETCYEVAGKLKPLLDKIEAEHERDSSN